MASDLSCFGRKMAIAKARPTEMQLTPWFVPNMFRHVVCVLQSALLLLDLVLLYHSAITLATFLLRTRAFGFNPSNAVQLLPQRRRVCEANNQPSQRVLCRGSWQRCIEIMAFFSQSKFSSVQRRRDHNGHDYQRQDIRRSKQLQPHPHAQHQCAIPSVLGTSSRAQEMYGLCVNGFADVSDRRRAAWKLISCGLL
jgi:hypothetical protein